MLNFIVNLFAQFVLAGKMRLLVKIIRCSTCYRRDGPVITTGAVRHLLNICV